MFPLLEIQKQFKKNDNKGIVQLMHQAIFQILKYFVQLVILLNDILFLLKIVLFLFKKLNKKTKNLQD